MTRVENDGTESEWCPECRARRTVTDQSEESVMTYHVEKGYHVWYLSCGHNVSVENGHDLPHGIQPDRFYR